MDFYLYFLVSLPQMRRKKKRGMEKRMEKWVFNEKSDPLFVQRHQPATTPSKESVSP